jgi:uncharacterized membrane protein YfhO
MHMTSFSNNVIEGEIYSRGTQLVFFSIPFDIGWKAKINGIESPILLVDGGLSAILVDPGRNTISLRYFPPFVETGFYLTLIGLLIFAVSMTKTTAPRNNSGIRRMAHGQ